eukprot:GHVS01045125.1.p1 GENE.GHVS01045125.1~~GHVS01045125.1.p1  ORF type:complete len:221 (-),score=15.16 GHVS01045125.1:62-724(-)
MDVEWVRHHVGVAVENLVGLTNQQVAAIWHYLCGYRLLHHDSCEPIVAAVAFFVWISLFRFGTLRSLCLPSPPAVSTGSWTRTVCSFTNTGYTIMNLQQLRSCTSFKRGVLPPASQLFDANRVCSAHGLASLLTYLGPLLFLDQLGGRRALIEAPPSFVRLVGELVLGIFVYDFLFYFPHLLVLSRAKTIAHILAVCADAQMPKYCQFAQAAPLVAPKLS